MSHPGLPVLYPLNHFHRQASNLKHLLVLSKSEISQTHKDNSSALKVDKKKEVQKWRKKNKTSHLSIFFESLHIWSLGTKKMHRRMTVLMGLSKRTGVPTNFRGDAEYLSSYLIKMQECAVCVPYPQGQSMLREAINPQNKACRQAVIL